MLTHNDTTESRIHFQLGLIALLLLFFSAYYAISVERSLVHDGAEWFYLILEKKTIRYHDMFWRQFNVVFQLPTVLILNIFPKIDIKYPIWVLHFFYNIHLFVSIFFLWIFTAKRQAYGFFYFAVLSCFIGSLSTHGFSVGIGSDTLTVFWPLFALIVLKRKNSMLELIVAMILIICLAFTYETAVLCFALISLVIILKIKNNDHCKFNYIIGSLSVLGLQWCLWRLIGPDSNYGKAQSSFHIEIPFLIWSIIFMSIFLAMLVANYLKIKKLKIINAMLLVTLFISTFTYAIHYFGPFGLFFEKSLFDMRLYSVPIGVFFALLAFIYLVLEEKKIITPDLIFKKTGIYFLSIAMFTGFVFDIQTSRDWMYGVRSFKEYLARHPGCSQWSIDDLKKQNIGGLIADWTTPFLSVVLQKSLYPSSIVFSSLYDDLQPRDYCREFSEKKIVINGYGIAFPTENSRFDFSKIVSEGP